MKNKLILGAAFLLAAITESLACTNLIVGKGASVDRSEERRVGKECYS